MKAIVSKVIVQLPIEIEMVPPVATSPLKGDDGKRSHHEFGGGVGLSIRNDIQFIVLGTPICLPHRRALIFLRRTPARHMDKSQVTEMQTGKEKTGGSVLTTLLRPSEKEGHLSLLASK